MVQQLNRVCGLSEVRMMAMRSRQQCFEERCRQKRRLSASRVRRKLIEKAKQDRKRTRFVFSRLFSPPLNNRRRVHPFVGACLSHAFGRILEKEHSTAVKTCYKHAVFICRPCSNRKYLCHASTSSIFCVVVIAEAKTIAS